MIKKSIYHFMKTKESKSIKLANLSTNFNKKTRVKRVFKKLKEIDLIK